jgi:hypothetical protein
LYGNRIAGCLENEGLPLSCNFRNWYKFYNFNA